MTEAIFQLYVAIFDSLLSQLGIGRAEKAVQTFLEIFKQQNIQEILQHDNVHGIRAVEQQVFIKLEGLLNSMLISYLCLDIGSCGFYKLLSKNQAIRSNVFCLTPYHCVWIISILVSCRCENMPLRIVHHSSNFCHL